ncbi:MAG: hypothetical protein BWX70_01175 [Verrucomicrobia bacterium ADurb.Bin070]|nr:MAG: hypothetical protein BWX70_01175 [Verrucomicrobia bacterium ADurb.Bin070]
MPAIAPGMPHSPRRRAQCGPKAWKYCVIATAAETSATLCRKVTGSPAAAITRDARGSQTSYRNAVGSSISRSYSSSRMNAASSGGSRYWKPQSGGTSTPGTP